MGPLRLWTPVVLAPMAGVTDVPFRRLCRIMGESGLPDHLRPTGIPSWAAESGQGATASSPKTPGQASDEPRHVAIPRVDAPAGLYVTEMVTSRALVEENERTLEMVRPDPAERVRSLQLYGVDPAVMAKAATMLIERDLTDHIDLNFGCPVPKVTKKGGGAALPWKRDLFTDLVGCRRARLRRGRGARGARDPRDRQDPHRHRLRARDRDGRRPGRAKARRRRAHPARAHPEPALRGTAPTGTRSRA